MALMKADIASKSSIGQDRTKKKTKVKAKKRR
jgi:hypothetical protein